MLGTPTQSTAIFQIPGATVEDVPSSQTKLDTHDTPVYDVRTSSSALDHIIGSICVLYIWCLLLPPLLCWLVSAHLPYHQALLPTSLEEVHIPRGFRWAARRNDHRVGEVALLLASCCLLSYPAKARVCGGCRRLCNVLLWQQIADARE